VFKPGANGVVDFGGDDVVAGIDASSLSVWTYTGRRYDSESGLLYYRTRYLDSEMGRFISRDTIGVWGDPASLGNGFSALLNAAQRVTDPCGTLGGKPNPEGLREHADKLGKLVSEFLVKARDWWNLSGCRGGLGTDYQSILDEATAAEFLARSTADAIDDAGDGLAWWQTALLGLFIVLAVAAVIAACVLSGGACAAVLGGGAVAGAVSG
jgi:RHS repeat-associated protein